MPHLSWVWSVQRRGRVDGDGEHVLAHLDRRPLEEAARALVRDAVVRVTRAGVVSTQVAPEVEVAPGKVPAVVRRDVGHGVRPLEAVRAPDDEPASRHQQPGGRHDHDRPRQRLERRFTRLRAGHHRSLEGHELPIRQLRTLQARADDGDVVHRRRLGHPQTAPDVVEREKSPEDEKRPDIVVRPNDLDDTVHEDVDQGDAAERQPHRHRTCRTDARRRRVVLVGTLRLLPVAGRGG